MHSRRPPRSLWALPLALAAAAGLLLHADEADRRPVGRQPDGSVIVPTNQVLRPAGTQITFPGRPVDLALAEEGKVLVVKNRSALLFIDVASARLTQTLPLGNIRMAGASPLGRRLSARNRRSRWPKGSGAPGSCRRSGRNRCRHPWPHR